jgi:hypothetical protein
MYFILDMYRIFYDAVSGSSVIPILSQLNLIHTRKSCFFHIHFSRPTVHTHIVLGVLYKQICYVRVTGFLDFVMVA